MGITKMKALAQSYVWWISVDKYLESLGKSCPECVAVKQEPTMYLCIPRYGLAAPVHLDFTAPFLERFFFVMVDSHSK